MGAGRTAATAALVVGLGWVGVALAAPQQAAPEEPEMLRQQQAVVEAGNQFACDLYAAIRSREGDLFLSPYSISTALGMAYAGARGRTAEQMAGVLRLTEEAGDVHAALGRVADQVGGGEGREFALRVANALWLQEGYDVLEEFRRVMAMHYGGAFERVDFQADPEAARGAINGWVEERTAGRIRDIIPAGVLNALTRLVLANAIYFKAAWLRPFPEGNTADEPFWLTADQSVPVPMMKAAGRFGYGESADAQVLSMPYVGGEVSMTVVLPRVREGLSALEQSLTAGKLTEWSQLGSREVIVGLPRFEITSQLRLDGVLRQLGMTDAFSGQADFSGIGGRRDLFISAALHKAFVDVNEEGTEAAAATAIVAALAMAPEPGRPPVFRADHPFLFLIRHDPTGAVLFIGRVTDPRD